jgi:hypothetical protein
MATIWTPDLSQIGVNASALPEDWGWATINKDEPWEAGEPLARQPHYGEFVIAQHVTEHAACNQAFDRARLVVATVSHDMREDGRRFLHGQQWRKSLTPWAAAPNWWLFGPQGEAFLAFLEQCQSDTHLWSKLDDDWHSPTALSAMALQDGPDRRQQWEIDELMGEIRRTGAISRALRCATEAFYSYRTNDYDPGRAVTNDELPYCDGTSLNGVSAHFRRAVGAVDNAVRWLILRDAMSPELYRVIAEPWQATLGWPLHPADAF